MSQPVTPRRASLRSRGAPFAVFGTLALISIAGLSRADAAIAPHHEARPLPPDARLSPSALGVSGGVRVRFALPGARVDLPLELADAPDSLAYAWIPVGTAVPIAPPLPLARTLRAPQLAGFYELDVLGRGGSRRVEGLTLGVMVPSSAKRGAALNGYRIGYYRGERQGRGKTTPTGFVEVSEEHAELPMSQHLTVADFLTRDGQTSWPRYAVVDTRLLDKLELVLAEIASWHGGAARAPITVEVRSGFRTPLHNGNVADAAGNSRHQFGDALDVAIDADRDGRLTAKDLRLVELAVEIVEREHPGLKGGLGIYPRGAASYAHIDARGERARWRG